MLRLERGTKLVHALRNTNMEPLWTTIASDMVTPGLDVQPSTAPDQNLIVTIGLGGAANSVAAERQRITTAAEANPGSRARAAIESDPECQGTGRPARRILCHPSGQQ